MQIGIVWTKGQGALELLLRSFEIPVVAEGNVCEDGVSLAEQRVKLEGVLGRRAGLGFGFAWWHIVVRHLPEQSIGAGKTGVGESVLRIFFDRLLVGLDAFVEVATMGPIETAPEIGIVGLRVDGACCGPGGARFGSGG